MAVTQAEIFELLKQYDINNLPTLRELRTMLGGGSLETISRSIHAYRRMQAEEAASQMPDAFRDAFRTAFDACAKDAWAVAAAHARLAAAMAEAADKTHVEKLEKDFTQLDAALSTAQLEITDRDKKIQSLIESAAVAKAEAKAAVEQATAAKAEAEELRSQLAQMAADLAAANARAGELDRQLTAAKSDAAALSEQLAASKVAQGQAEAALIAYRRSLGDKIPQP